MAIPNNLPPPAENPFDFLDEEVIFDENTLEAIRRMMLERPEFLAPPPSPPLINNYPV
ncbi:MAG TPA: hypothetical protein P5048_01850 [Chlamydiales bacterium]|nr:hypothetical protein [Chlamydiales bacterium]